MAFSVESDAGVSLADAILLYGDLSERERRLHHLMRLKLRSAKDGQPCGRPVTEEELAEYCEREVAGQDRVRKKLENGEVYAEGICRSGASSINDASARAHRDQWRVLVPDFETSSASSAAGVIIEGILVFATDNKVAEAAAAPTAYGQKSRTAKAYIGEHKNQLRSLGREEQVRRIMAAAKCSRALAYKAIEDETESGGQLSGHK